MFRIAENTDTAEMDAIVIQNTASARSNASDTNDSRYPDVPPQPGPQLDSTSDVSDNNETFSALDCAQQTSILYNTEVYSSNASAEVETEAATTEQEYNMINAGDISKQMSSRIRQQIGVDLNRNSACTRLRSSLAETVNLQKVNNNLEYAVNTIEACRRDSPDVCVSSKHREKLCTVESQVDGITSDSCSGGIEATVSGIKDVGGIAASLANKMATVTLYDSALVAAGDIVDGIEDIGFEVTLKKHISKESTDERSNNGDAYVFSVEGMTCRSCAQTIERCLSAIEGIGDVSVSLEYNMATVQSGRHKLDPTNVIGAIDDLGFSASLLTRPANDPDETEECDRNGKYMDIIPNYAGHPGK